MDDDGNQQLELNEIADFIEKGIDTFFDGAGPKAVPTGLSKQQKNNEETWIDTYVLWLNPALANSNPLGVEPPRLDIACLTCIFGTKRKQIETYPQPFKTKPMDAHCVIVVRLLLKVWWRNCTAPNFMPLSAGSIRSKVGFKPPAADHGGKIQWVG